MIETLETIYNFLIKFLPFSFGFAFIGFIVLFLLKIFENDKVKKSVLFYWFSFSFWVLL